MSRLLIDPLVSFDLIEREELNAKLIEWDHQHGPLNRPLFKAPADYGLRHRGELVAVVSADSLIRPTCNLDRSHAFEVSRVCGAAPGLCTTALRLWRAFAYPAIATAWGTPWVISYQDAIRHEGNLYRRDSWALIGFSSGGADPRAASATVNVKRRLIWAWNADREVLTARREAARKDRPNWPEWAGGKPNLTKAAA